jgi:chromosome segregation ATPase
MDNDQLAQRLEWLDKERRKDSLTIATLSDRVAKMENSSNGLESRIKNLSSEVTQLTTMLAKFDQVDAGIAQLRLDLTKMIDGIEKTRNERERDMEKLRVKDGETLQKSLADLKKMSEPVSDLKKSLQARVEEEHRLSKELAELGKRFDDSQHSDEEYLRIQKLMEEAQKQDSKRLADLQAENLALRKRLDEIRGKVDMTTESARKTEMRINELQTAEGERKQSQNAFIEKQAMQQVDRERIWKEWQTRFEDFSKERVNLDSQVQTLDAMQRSLKRSQDTFDEVNQRFERRINEITEMQRLVEERFRQEWVNFKADDLKRWTNYTLSQEEQQREYSRLTGRMDERLVALEDEYQQLQDLTHQINDETHKRLQGLLALSHEMMEEFTRTFQGEG